MPGYDKDRYFHPRQTRPFNGFSMSNTVYKKRKIIIKRKLHCLSINYTGAIKKNVKNIFIIE